MRLMIAVTLLLLKVAACQKQAACPQTTPIDSGNITEPFYYKILSLTTFLGYQDDGPLFSAFYQYAKTGERRHADQILMNSNKVFLVIIAVISTVAFSLLLVVNRMGQLHLTTKSVFQALKQKGFSSALSAFYAFVTILLLASASINAQEIERMISKVQVTSCRLDALNQAFQRGAVGHDWQGLPAFSQKLSNYSSFAAQLSSLTTNYQNQTQPLFYARSYLSSLWQQYLSIVNTYTPAFIGDQYNPTKRINLTTLLPNLFSVSQNETSPLAPLLGHFALLNQTLQTATHLQSALSTEPEVFSNWSRTLSAVSQSLKSASSDFSSDYISLRQNLAVYLSQDKSVLIICQVITGLTLFCTLAGLLSLKLIQSSYDYFSLSSYKVMWTFHVFMLAMSLLFLILVNQSLVYNRGVCVVADQLIANGSAVEDIFPKTKAPSGVYYLYACYNDSEFGEITQTERFTDVLAEIMRIKQLYTNGANIQKMGYYYDILSNITEELRPYQFGLKGNISFIDSQLQSINAITSANYQNQGCYKHHWVYGPSDCSPSQSGIVKPKTIDFLNNTLRYSDLPSMCYVLSDYTSNEPTAIGPSAFYRLYGPYSAKCPKSNSALAAPIDQFLQYFQSRRCVVGRLIDSIGNLSGLINRSSQQLGSYISVVSELLRQAGPSEGHPLSQGKDCSILKQTTIGIYNDFCINYAGSLRTIYLLAICNIAYIFLMVLFSLLYALELRNLVAQDLGETYPHLQFDATSLDASGQSSVQQSAASREELADQQYSQKADQQYSQK